MNEIITPLVVAGVGRLGAYASGWVKGSPPERLAAALAASMDENQYQFLSFQSLVDDDEYRLLVEDANKQLRFDDARAAAILRRYVDDIRGEEQTKKLVGDVAELLRALLPLFASGGSKALALQTGLQHQDAVKAQRVLDETWKGIEQIQETLASMAAANGAAAAPQTLILDRHWLSGRATEAWQRLLDENPDAAARLRQRLGDEPTDERIREYLTAGDDATALVWETVMTIADEQGESELAEEAALRYANSDGADPVRGLAWAAGLADQRSATELRDQLRDQARALDERHPSLLLLDARLTPDPRARLGMLADVEPIDDRQRAALEGARALAHLQMGDADAAFSDLARAKAADPNDLLAAEVEASLIVADAREGRGLTWQKAETAIDDLVRVRDRLRAAKRFDLSVQILGKITQVHLLFGGGPRQIREAVASLLPEERSRDEIAQIAAALVASGDAAGALELLPADPHDEYARFVLASALLSADKDRFLREGVPILDELLEAQDEALRPEAAWLRAGAGLVDDPAPGSDDALAVLDEHDPVRARLYRAVLAERSDPAEAEAILIAGGEQPELLIERGRLAAKAGDPEKAIALYRRVTQLDPSPINQLAFADALREAGQRDAARQEALAIARRGEYPPYVRDTAYRIAYTIAQESRDLGALADIAEEWLSFDEKNPKVAWSFVWSLVRLARYGEARSVVERRGLRPADEQDAELYADVLIHTAPPEEALERLLAVADDVPDVRGVEARLAMLALAVDAERVPPESLERAAARLQSYPQQFPEGGIQQYEIDLADPLRDIRPHLERRAQAVAEVSEALTRGEVPLAAVAAATGRDVGSLLLGLNLLPLGFGNAAVDALELQDARQAVGNPVVWESTAINVGGGLGRSISDKIRGAFQTPTVAQAVIDDARLGAHDAMAAVPAGTLGMNPSTGEVFYHEYEPGELDREAHRAKSILGLLNGFNVSPNVDESSEGVIGKWVREEGHLENPALATAEATLAVVERTAFPLYSDDPLLRAHARGVGVGAFGTPCLLQAMQEQGMLDAVEVGEAIATLLRSGAQGIPTDLFDPVAAARAADWELTLELRSFLLDVRRWNNDLEANLRRWHAFLRTAVTEATYTQFRRWAFRVVDAMMLALPDNDPEVIVAGAATAALAEESTEVEQSYRRQLLSALNSVRSVYGIKKSVGRLVSEWDARAQAAMSEQHDDAQAAPQDTGSGSA
jgi:hypothetical protein